MENQDAPSAKWIQLAFGVLCMAMIANLQYGWTLFVDPINAKFHWGRPAIQLAFTLFVVTETWLVPVEAWFVDRYGPRSVVLFGGVMIALAWTLNSYADSLFLLYAAAVVGGIGAGSVYGTCVGNALKWFPNQRGLAAGCTAAGFGAGAALTVVPIARMIESSGYQKAFFTFGLGQGIVVFIVALFLRKPKNRRGADAQARQPSPDQHRSHAFRAWCAARCSGCSTRCSSWWPPAASWRRRLWARSPRTSRSPASTSACFGLTMAALTLAISLDRIFDGFGRPLFGYVSDRIGRENTMGIAFSRPRALHGAGDVRSQPDRLHPRHRHYSSASLARSTACSRRLPATRSGPKYAATNNGLLYTAKGTAAFLVPIASIVSASYGWSAVFAVTAVFNVIAASAGAVRAQADAPHATSRAPLPWRRRP